MPNLTTRNLVLGAALFLGAAAAIGEGSGSGGGASLSGANVSAKALVTRPLIFRDGSGGDIFVFDKSAEKPFAVLKRDENSFIANTVRLLAVERVRRGAGGRDAPFNLILWSDGRLSFADPATGETVELAAFGVTNARSFARLLPSNARL